MVSVCEYCGGDLLFGWHVSSWVTGLWIGIWAGLLAVAMHS